MDVSNISCVSLQLEWCWRRIAPSVEYFINVPCVHQFSVAKIIHFSPSMLCVLHLVAKATCLQPGWEAMIACERIQLSDCTSFPLQDSGFPPNHSTISHDVKARFGEWFLVKIRTCNISNHKFVISSFSTWRKDDQNSRDVAQFTIF